MFLCLASRHINNIGTIYNMGYNRGIVLAYSFI